MTPLVSAITQGIVTLDPQRIGKRRNPSGPPHGGLWPDDD
jgi:hypothetical protein